ncbi:MAG: Ppx/GppA family phosphatase [Syntrophomonadaceae bacterium]|jgi:exopolyphosphatase/guanosine-5'-triphosphate,3'-diphosphate pyrophosphatase|nr:Ppx/GppA family phosphatase [Syntrophomonadaceae bacterium]
MKIGAIDIGSNSCRLLIAELGESENLKPLARAMETTRLGEGLSETKRLSKTAMDKTARCLADFHNILKQMNVKQYRLVATSAVREAENKDEFLDRLKNELHLKVDVISGEREAQMSYAGVKKGLCISGPFVVVDLGGGSTEFTWEYDEGMFVYSLKLGAVRAAESAMESGQAENILRSLYEHKRKLSGYHMVFVGGTATTLAAVKKKLKEYDYSEIHGQILTKNELWELYKCLKSLSPEQKKRLPGLQPERADIIVSGAMIVCSVVEFFEKELIQVSESDILEGIIWASVDNRL